MKNLLIAFSRLLCLGVFVIPVEPLPLDWIEVGYRHWKAKVRYGGWYEVYASKEGWVWRYHVSATDRIYGEEVTDEAEGKACCEEHRQGNRQGRLVEE